MIKLFIYLRKKSFKNLNYKNLLITKKISLQLVYYWLLMTGLHGFPLKVWTESSFLYVHKRGLLRIFFKMSDCLCVDRWRPFCPTDIVLLFNLLLKFIIEK